MSILWIYLLSNAPPITCPLVSQYHVEGASLACVGSVLAGVIGRCGSTRRSYLLPSGEGGNSLPRLSSRLGLTLRAGSTATHPTGSQKGDPMARIIVTPDQTVPGAAPVLLDESVYSVHLSTSHAAMQLVERLGWALSDAEEIERGQPDRGAPMRARNRGAPSRRKRGGSSRRSRDGSSRRAIHA